MDTVWYGVKIAFGVVIGLAVIGFLIRILREVRGLFALWRFSRAGCSYQAGDLPDTPSGWLIRDIRNDDWLLWDENNHVVLRVSDKAQPGEPWQISRESLKEFISLAHQEKTFWERSNTN